MDQRSSASTWKPMETRIVNLVTEVKESLERQINTGFENLTSRLDAQATRLGPAGGDAGDGRPLDEPLIAWSEKVDVSLEKRAREIGEMRSRLNRIEGARSEEPQIL